ncbi:MAG: hypothetical protein AB8F95_00935 [Bacteroidia bacterium]
MKTLLAISLTLLLFTVSACKNDDTPDPGDKDIFTIRLDQGEFLSPILPDGTFEAAVRFESSVLGDAAGGKLYAADVYIFEIPQNLFVKIYRGSEADSPRTLVHQQDVTLGREARAWNTIALDDSIDVPEGEDLWISMQFQQNAQGQTIGCDVGPAVTNGDWFYDNAVNQWVTYREATNNGTDINWNIRGKVAK